MVIFGLITFLSLAILLLLGAYRAMDNQDVEMESLKIRIATLVSEKRALQNEKRALETASLELIATTKNEREETNKLIDTLRRRLQSHAKVETNLVPLDRIMDQRPAETRTEDQGPQTVLTNPNAEVGVLTPSELEQWDSNAQFREALNNTLQSVVLDEREGFYGSDGSRSDNAEPVSSPDTTEWVSDSSGGSLDGASWDSGSD